MSFSSTQLDACINTDVGQHHSRLSSPFQIDNMFSSPTLSRYPRQSSAVDSMSSKRLIDEQAQTIEQLKAVIDELKVRHERKERELTKRLGTLYHDLQQSKKKLAHLLYKHQQQKKVNRTILPSFLVKLST